ncbi:MAG: relaxase domain-containing protein [Actinomycetota bacterium]|nr:relaxase domain-containing protein [Actinomycetota bacterium]
MTVTIRRMGLGSGYRYLMSSVALGDGGVHRSTPLMRYYGESGTPPGRFLGAGLAGLNGGGGILGGAAADEQMLYRMFGTVADPVSGRRLGQAPYTPPRSLRERISAGVEQLPPGLSGDDLASRIAAIAADEAARTRRLRRSVAGFDLIFSVAKSVSAVWAVADVRTRDAIYEAHHAAIGQVTSWAERNVFFTRSGSEGSMQQQVRGVVAVGFDHWDSRAGDPHLHTHLLVLNRAQAADGVWRTLDSRALLKQAGVLSEMHEGVVADLLADRLGWEWDTLPKRSRSTRRLDVAGVPQEIMSEFSQRSRHIEAAMAELTATFALERGRQPSAVDLIRLRQRAALITRPDKTQTSLEARTAQWRARAAPHVAQDLQTWVRTLCRGNDGQLLGSDELSDAMLADVAMIALDRVVQRRATFTRANVLAEVHRQLFGVRFPPGPERGSIADRITVLALSEALTVDRAGGQPPANRGLRPGRSRFVGRGTEIYTTPEIIDAEQRLRAAGRLSAGPVAAIAHDADSEFAVTDANPSAQDQEMEAVNAIATSGRHVDVFLGRAGEAKTTTLARLRTVWEQEHGAGSVIGLAPSVAAAEGLSASIGIHADDSATWLSERRCAPDHTSRISELQRRLATMGSPGSVLARSISARIESELKDQVRWSIRPGQLVIFDEAGMASTLALDEIVAHAAANGGKVVLVGDRAQLSPRTGGGGLALLVRDRAEVPEVVVAETGAPSRAAAAERPRERYKRDSPGAKVMLAIPATVPAQRWTDPGFGVGR